MNSIIHVRKKAEELRRRGYTLSEICTMLCKGKSTVYYWVKDIEVENKNAFIKKCRDKMRSSQVSASFATRRKFKKLHEDSRLLAEKMWNEGLKDNIDFLQFVMLYWCEGYRKTKHSVQIANSDECLLMLGNRWIKKLTSRPISKIEYNIQYHVDQNVIDLCNYWKNRLSCNEIKVIRKSNSGTLSGRKWRSKYGVLSIRVSDTYLKTKIDFWIDKLKEELTTGCGLIG